MSTATRKSTASRASKTVEKPTANPNAELENQVASLVAKIASLEKELADLKNTVNAQPAPAAAPAAASASGRDEELRLELRKWIKTMNNPKRPTILPNI